MRSSRAKTGRRVAAVAAERHHASFAQRASREAARSEAKPSGAWAPAKDCRRAKSIRGAVFGIKLVLLLALLATALACGAFPLRRRGPEAAESRLFEWGNA